jgi:ATP-dependent helicase/nuclease subunit A
VVSPPEKTQASLGIENSGKVLPEGTLERLQASLVYKYQHLAATCFPSKQTATQRKGRLKDQEVAEEAQEPKILHRSWKTPSFKSGRSGGKDYGSAVHTVLQYISLSNCSNEAEIREEVQRLVSRKLLTSDQAEMVDCGAIAAFFDTEVGRILRSGVPIVREFKFSILDDGIHYAPGLEKEQVLLQGVVDCAILADDGITVIDFKTDAVTEQTLPQLVARYTPQVQTYVQALHRIYGKPIKEALLYFFDLNCFVNI